MDQQGFLDKLHNIYNEYYGNTAKAENDTTAWLLIWIFLWDIFWVCFDYDYLNKLLIIYDWNTIVWA